MSEGCGHGPRHPKPFSNPYLAGIGLGLVLLAAFVFMGRGLGASGAFSSFIAWFVHKLAPAHAEANAFYMNYIGDGTFHPLKSWLVFEVIGVFFGGLLSGWIAQRVIRGVERGPRSTVAMRLIFALIGGALMGYGAKLGSGCTSGQALTGGASLNLGSWTFMMCIFAGAYLMAPIMRRQWR